MLEPTISERVRASTRSASRFTYSNCHWGDTTKYASVMQSSRCSARSVARTRAVESTVVPASRAGLSPSHSTTTRSEEHTSELQSLMRISYAVFCLKKKKNHKSHGSTASSDYHVAGYN